MSRLARLRDALAHAFSTRPAELSAEDTALLDRLAAEVRRRGLSTAAIVSLEAARPVAGVAGHSVDYLRPLLTPLAAGFGGDIDWADVSRLLRNPRAVDRLAEAVAAGGPDDRVDSGVEESDPA